MTVTESNVNTFFQVSEILVVVMTVAVTGYCVVLLQPEQINLLLCA